MLLCDKNRRIGCGLAVVAVLWVSWFGNGNVAQAAAIDSLNQATVINDGKLQGVSNTLDAILRAVNPNGDDESRVSTRVKEAMYTNSLNWVRMFNSQDDRNQLPFADAFLGGYVRHFFKIFLDQQTDERVRETNDDKVVRLRGDLVSGDNQFNMNASSSVVSSTVGNSYAAIKSVTGPIIQASDFAKDGTQPVNLLTQQDVKTQTVLDYPNSQDLLGPNRYDDQQQKRAALFVRSLLSGTDIMSDVTVKYSNNRLEVCVPSGAEGYKWITFSGVKEKEYKAFREALDKLKVYQEFKVKQLAANALRSLYTANIVSIYSDRIPQVEVKYNNGKKVELRSVAELEDEVARMGIDAQYLESVKNGTVADFQLEVLATLNRIVYFLDRIYRSCERSSAAMSAAAIKLTAPDTSTDSSYYTPISNWVKNECWKNGDSDQCKNLGTSGGLGELVSE